MISSHAAQHNVSVLRVLPPRELQALQSFYLDQRNDPTLTPEELRALKARVKPAIWYLPESLESLTASVTASRAAMGLPPDPAADTATAARLQESRARHN